MSISFEEALKNTDVTYEQISEIAKSMVAKSVGNINDIIKTLSENITTLTNDEIRDYILALSVKSFSFSEIKECSILKSEIAETLKKEAYSNAFTSLEGAVALKENKAYIETINENCVELLYDMVSSSLKTKLDEVHRVVDSLKTVLMTRIQEAKLLCTETTEER